MNAGLYITYVCVWLHIACIHFCHHKLHECGWCRWCVSFAVFSHAIPPPPLSLSLFCSLRFVPFHYFFLLLNRTQCFLLIRLRLRTEFYFQFYSFYLELPLKFYWSDWWFCVLMKSRYDSSNNEKTKGRNGKSMAAPTSIYAHRTCNSKSCCTRIRAVALATKPPPPSSSPSPPSKRERTNNDRIFARVRIPFSM